MILEFDGVQYDIGRAQYPSKRKRELVQVKEKSASGVIYREDFSVDTSTITYVFSDMETPKYQTLLSFFIDIVNGTMETFILRDDVGAVLSCNFSAPILNFEKKGYELWSGSFTVEAAS